MARLPLRCGCGASPFEAVVAGMMLAVVLSRLMMGLMCWSRWKGVRVEVLEARNAELEERTSGSAERVAELEGG